MSNVMEMPYTPEQIHLSELIAKCRKENDPSRLLCHFTAIKTLLLAHVLQQNTFRHQLQSGAIVEGKIEDKLMETCFSSLGDTKKTVRQLHNFLRQYEEQEEHVSTMEFRVKANKLISRFDKNLASFLGILTQVSGKQKKVAAVV